MKKNVKNDTGFDWSERKSKKSKRWEITNISKLKRTLVTGSRYDGRNETGNMHSLYSGVRWIVVLVAIVGFSIMTSTSTALAAPLGQTASEGAGEATFGQICGACHTIGGGTRVGPDLQGVVDRREEAWIKVHILNPSVHHEQNDPTSVANREQYGLQMPDLGLTESQVEALVAYLKSTITAPSVTPPLYPFTLGAGVLAIVLITILGLYAGQKKVEVRL